MAVYELLVLFCSRQDKWKWVLSNAVPRPRAKEKQKSRKNDCDYQSHIPRGWHLSNQSILNCFILTFLQWVISSEKLHIMKDVAEPEKMPNICCFLSFV